MMTSKIIVAVVIQIFYATIDILTNDLHIHSLPLFVEILCEISNKPTTLSFLGLKLHILKNFYLTNNMTFFLSSISLLCNQDSPDGLMSRSSLQIKL